MSVFWKTFFPVFMLLSIAACVVTYSLVSREVLANETDTVSLHKALVRLLSREVEKGYAENRWPVEGLGELPGQGDFLFWWVVRADGTIDLANDASFRGTHVADHFPQAVTPSEDGQVALDYKKGRGVVINPVQVGDQPWSLWLGFSLREISDMRKRAILAAMGVLLATLLLLGGILYFVIGHFTRPIEDLSAAAARIGAGDLDHRVEVRSHDELGQLAESFNEMVGNLRTVTASRDALDGEIRDRRRAEEALRESQDKLDAMLQSIADHMSMMDRELNVIWANDTAKRIFGEDIVGRKCYEVYHGRSQPCEPHPCVTLRAFEDGKVHEHDTRVQAANGEILYFHCTANVALRDADGKAAGVIEISRNVSEERRAAEALKEAYSIINRSPAVAFLWRNEPAWPVAFVSENVAQLCGYTAHELTSGDVSYAEIIHPDDLERVTREIDTHGGQSGTTSFAHQPYRIVTREGRVTWVEHVTHIRRDAHGDITHYEGVVTDITRHKEAEAEIAELKRQIEYILGATKTGLDIIDADFNIRYIDPEWAKAYGDPTGRKCYEYFMGRTEVCPGCGIVKALATKSLTITEEILVKENGRRVQVTTIPFQNVNGEWLVAEVNVDITESRQMEEALRQRTLALERSNTELQQFAYVASHDLQEPLRMVASYVQLLARRYKGKLDPDADDFIQFATDGAKRMQDLINALLEYSRVGTRGKAFAPTDCNEVFQRTLSNIEVAVREGRAQVTSDTLPTVMADDIQLGQLFQNLISNGIKFQDGGVPQVHVSAERADGKWVFSVRDNGIGIDPKYAGRIFAIFQRLHERDKFPGTGIGLAICQKIVERHGGRIWVESQPGAGSTFYFTLPTAAEESP